ncbi:MAG: response regulator transcription factor [Pseudomonadota bacterium]|nr:response regulator transcription factor [Pseudomonadota bacterium]
MARIYLIDDHPIVRAGLSALLQGAGHTIVGEGQDITQALSDVNRLEPDVLMLDLHLDGRSGFEVLAEMQRRQMSTKVIVLSMSDQPRNVAEALRMGASGYVLKGSASVELVAAVDAVMQGRRYLGEDLTDIAVQGLTSDADRGSTLSPRERQILVMVASGKSSAGIGGELHLSPKTVDTYRSRLMAKLELADVPALVRWAIREKLIDL